MIYKPAVEQLLLWLSGAQKCMKISVRRFASGGCCYRLQKLIFSLIFRMIFAMAFSLENSIMKKEKRSESEVGQAVWLSTHCRDAYAFKEERNT